MRIGSGLAAAVLAVVLQGGAQRDQPARLVEDGVPALPQQTLAGGEVIVELTVGPDGRVRRIDPLRVTPPYTDLVAAAVKSWRFEPATRPTTGERQAVEARVLVVALFRPPALYAGPAPGEPPRTVAPSSRRVPFPRELALPAYPPTGVGDRVVVLEIEVGPDGQILGIRTVASAGAFDDAAIQAVRRWSFDPARLDGEAVRSFLYAIFGFRQPVVAAPRPPR